MGKAMHPPASVKQKRIHHHATTEYIQSLKDKT